MSQKKIALEIKFFKTRYSVDCQWFLGWSIPFFVLVDLYPFYCIKRVWIDQDVIDGPHCIYYLQILYKSDSKITIVKTNIVQWCAHGRYIAVAVVVGGHCHILPTNSLY